LFFLLTFKNETESPTIIPKKRAVSSIKDIDMEMDQNKKLTSTASVFWKVKTATSASRINRLINLKVGMRFSINTIFKSLR